MCTVLSHILFWLLLYLHTFALYQMHTFLFPTIESPNTSADSQVISFLLNFVNHQCFKLICKWVFLKKFYNKIHTSSILHDKYWSDVYKTIYHMKGQKVHFLIIWEGSSYLHNLHKLCKLVPRLCLFNWSTITKQVSKLMPYFIQYILSEYILSEHLT